MNLRLLSAILPLRRRAMLRDTRAGISMALMDIPQVLGYTHIAAMPLVTGLYTLFLPVLVFAMFASSRHLVVAADSATAAIFSSGLSSMAAPASAHYVELVGMVALLSAGFLLLARIFRLGFVADFLSRTVLIGFLSGVGVQVGIAMLAGLFGMHNHATSTPEQLIQFVRQVGSEMHAPTALLSLGVVTAIFLAKRWTPRWPMALLAVLVSIASSYVFDFQAQGIDILGEIPGGLPGLGLPHVSQAELIALLPIALSCVIIIIAQSAVTARGFAMKYKERVDEDADILGLSAANMAAALSGTFVVNGSPTQTAMADSVGARSQWAHLVFALVVMLALLFFTAPMQYLPDAVLAAIVLTIAASLVDVRGLRAIYAESPGEFALALLTAVTVVLVGVMQGIVLAMILSLLRHVRHSYRPHTMLLVPDDAGRWLPTPAVFGQESAPGLLVYRFGADLFYANEYRFTDELRGLVASAPHPVRWLVVDASAMTDLDFTAAAAARELFDELKVQGVRVLFARVSPYLRADMDRHRLSASLGGDAIFSTLHEALESARGFA
ncbi:MAG: SulP family inorganic anion transporter [Halothiobacillaceae bacterium]